MEDKWFTFLQPGWLAAGLGKQKIALDVLSLGYDLFLMDSDLVFFRDPMEIVRNIWNADFATLSDCVAFNYSSASFSQIPHGWNMGVLWARSVGQGCARRHRPPAGTASKTSLSQCLGPAGHRHQLSPSRHQRMQRNP
jgi:hypothetical protein